VSLPGYDDWLDNHGNPGIDETATGCVDCDLAEDGICDECLSASDYKWVLGDDDE
jgi:hypothetical protein